ncbi:hypothetical protein CAEBREN_08774 [Caenorhabditis brenneri]|uniref:Uncharacterized protein n=1 Tax=Caenorhabditis brenneri TaxID=135651 RepID=G0NF33_CAEBE|nr:hypothetical protein CAEBREN_08774 [Caenorhabditis brenneri]
MLCALLFFSSFSLLRAAIPACNNGVTTFDPPLTVGMPSWYPSNYTNTKPPIFPGDFKCEYKINVPTGWFALIQMTVDMTYFQNVSAPVIVIDQLQNREEVYSAQQERFFFASNGGTIRLSTGMTEQLSFGFKITWLQYPAMSPNITRVNAGDRNPLVLKHLVNDAFQFVADYQVSATIMPLLNPLDRQYYRGIMFFDGPNGNVSCLGSGLSLLNSKAQYYSTGKSMTIMFLPGNPIRYFTSILLQDYINTKGIGTFQGITWSLQNPAHYASFLMDASISPVAIQTLNINSNSEVILSLTGTGSLDVYLGGATKNRSNLVTSYNAKNCDNYFPQLFLGDIKTYVLTSGVAILNISEKSYQDYSPSKAIGRKGFLVTENYGVLSPNQQISEGIYSPPNVSITVFKYSIQLADLVPGVTLKITNHTNGQETYHQYNSNNLPRLNVSNEIQGEKFFVRYFSNGKANKGFHLDFELIEASSSSIFSIIGVVVLLTFLLF